MPYVFILGVIVTAVASLLGVSALWAILSGVATIVVAYALIMWFLITLFKQS